MSKNLEQFVEDLLDRINRAEEWGKSQAEASSSLWYKGTNLIWANRWSVAGDLVHELAEKYGVEVPRRVGG